MESMTVTGSIPITGTVVMTISEMEDISGIACLIMTGTEDIPGIGIMTMTGPLLGMEIIAMIGMEKEKIGIVKKDNVEPASSAVFFRGRSIQGPLCFTVIG
jgi:hypothetical protein